MGLLPMANCTHYVGQLVLVKYTDDRLGSILIPGTITDMLGNSPGSHRILAPDAECPNSTWPEHTIFPVQSTIEDGAITYG